MAENERRTYPEAVVSVVRWRRCHRLRWACRRAVVAGDRRCTPTSATTRDHKLTTTFKRNVRQRSIRQLAHAVLQPGEDGSGHGIDHERDVELGTCGIHRTFD